MTKEQITELLSNQEIFKKVISSKFYTDSLNIAIGDFINVRELLTLYFIEGLSEKDLSVYYNVRIDIIETWIVKIFNITNAFVNKNQIKLTNHDY